MGIGKRVPIAFMAMTATSAEGGATVESFAPTYSTWAKVDVRSSNRNIAGEQVQMNTVYRFSEIRQTVEFTPTKSMLISYQGLQLVIESIVLDQSKAPYYYSINAVMNV